MGSANRIGLFGGSFDPPHLGHALIAQDGCEALGLDELWFIPAYRAPLKEEEPIASAQDRLEMVRRVAAGDNRFRVWDGEIRARKSRYTVETVGEIRQSLPNAELFWLIGLDQLVQLHRWHEVDRLRSMVSLVAFGRPGVDTVPERGLFSDVPVMKVHAFEVSSSEIRERLTRGLSVSIFLNPEVNTYIREQALYRSRT